MEKDVIWQSAFSIMRTPLSVSTITTLFPIQPTNSYNSNERVIHGERYSAGVCEYRLQQEQDQSTFLATLSAWLDLLEPYCTVFLHLHAQEYECFLEIWTSATDGGYELSYPLLQRLAALAIDLELRFGIGDEAGDE